MKSRSTHLCPSNLRKNGMSTDSSGWLAINQINNSSWKELNWTEIIVRYYIIHVFVLAAAQCHAPDPEIIKRRGRVPFSSSKKIGSINLGFWGGINGISTDSLGWRVITLVNNSSRKELTPPRTRRMSAVRKCLPLPGSSAGLFAGSDPWRVLPVVEQLKRSSASLRTTSLPRQPVFFFIWRVSGGRSRAARDQRAGQAAQQ